MRALVAPGPTMRGVYGHAFAARSPSDGRIRGGASRAIARMAVLRTVARPLLASIYVIQGFDALRRPEGPATKVESVVRLLAPVVSLKTTQAVRVNGGVQVVAGTLLSLGRMPRVSALVLAASLVPTTVAGHGFWKHSDAEQRAAQRVQFVKNMSMLGGLLLAVADTAGKPSLAWRGRHAAKTLRRDVAISRASARMGGAPDAIAHRLWERLPGT